ncbi:MAG: DnaJ domain-containing protein [Hyphomicrobiales bacterium]|nr:DnaJ domain-containing protein [Hyphomicrobiales bacterium]
MKLDSKYFDAIRVAGRRQKATHARGRRCEWPGCGEAGVYMAPKGRGRDGEYFCYCLTHVRDYNKTYNYFSGMSDAELREFQRDAVTGHRPTWAAGVNQWAEERARQSKRAGGFHHTFETADPFGVFGETAEAPHKPRRVIRNAERKCLRTLNLDDTATAQDIKTNFKALVKAHHPDRHGGDKASEEKLREVISAYNYLKQAGLC